MSKLLTSLFREKYVRKKATIRPIMNIDKIQKVTYCSSQRSVVLVGNIRNSTWKTPEDEANAHQRGKLKF